MARSFVLATLLSVALVSCGGAESADPPADSPSPAPPPSPTAPAAAPRFDRPAPMEASGPPTRGELFLLLSENADVPLSTGEFCDGVVGVELDRPPLLGDWIAYNLSVLEDPPISLPASCQDDGETWVCSVEFAADSDGESPWSWGVRFSMRKSDRRPLPDSLMCSGAG